MSTFRPVKIHTGLACLPTFLPIFLYIYKSIDFVSVLKPNVYVKIAQADRCKMQMLQGLRPKMEEKKKRWLILQGNYFVD